MRIKRTARILIAKLPQAKIVTPLFAGGCLFSWMVQQSEQLPEGMQFHIKAPDPGKAGYGVIRSWVFFVAQIGPAPILKGGI